MIFQFISVLLVSVFALASTSLLWPRFTTIPRPQPLQQVHDIVIGTQYGQQAADVLGVSDDRTIEPIELQTLAQQGLARGTGMVKQRVQDVLYQHASRQVLKQLDSLPPDQRQQLQLLVCQPTIATPQETENPQQ